MAKYRPLLSLPIETNYESIVAKLPQNAVSVNTFPFHLADSSDDQQSNLEAAKSEPRC